MGQFDYLIRGGQVCDGTGAPSRHLDVGIRDGVITDLAPSLHGDADQVIDAHGHLVTPGFIDVHTHYDGLATWDAHVLPSASLGTTTVVMGNCGVGFAPCRAADHGALMELMEGVEEIPGTAMDEGLPWDWESFPEYLASLEARQRDVDVAALLPHGPLRVYVMGERALRREPATDADIAAMQGLLREGIAAGAVGFSTTRTMLHRSATGALAPTYEAATDELKALGSVLSGEAGNVFQLISDWRDVEDEFSILHDAARTTGAKGTFTLVQDPRQPELHQKQLRLIEAAQAAGQDIRGQVLSRPIGVLMGLRTSMHPFYRRPSYLALSALPWDERLAQLQRPDVKARILGERNESPHIFVRIFERLYERMHPLQVPINYLPEPEDCVAARAAADGAEPASWLYDYLVAGDGTNLVYIPGANTGADTGMLLEHAHTVCGLGDGGAHVGSICDASANLYVLTKWVRQERAFSLESAIHMLTGQPAELYSFHDRGRIAPGFKADINVIDLERLALATPHIVHDLPAGGMRLLQRAEGIRCTLLSGEVTYRDGEPTGALPGKLLRGAQPPPTAA